jgi:hypothetical protein
MTELPAGRELDALIAEKVMGWRFMHDGLGNMRWYQDTVAIDGYGPNHWGGYRDFSPSTDIAAAWEIVKKMRARGIPLRLVLVCAPGDPEWWYASFEANGWQVESNTAPLAICRAALRAAGA